MGRWHPWVVVWLVACGGGAAVPDAVPGVVDSGAPDGSPADAQTPCNTEDPILLTPGSPDEDEDPSVLLAADGRLVVAYFAHRGGNADLYITTSADGQTWEPSTRITTDVNADFAPSLIQDAAGRFHLAWHRQLPSSPYYMHIRYTSTTDPAVWDIADEVAVTSSSGLIGDWVPTLAQRPDGDLMIVFASGYRDATPGGEHQLYWVTSPDGAVWSAPVALAGINDGVEHDHLPFLARTDQGMALAWVRYDTTNATPWMNPSADVMVATSIDGETWTAPVNVTHDDAAGALDLFPTLYRQHDGVWSLAWLTTSLSPSGSVVDVPLAAAADYPDGLVELPLLGYSPRITATASCEYLGAWVAGPVGAQDISVRLFAK